MAIERVDSQQEYSDDIGWAWEDCNGYMEKLVVNDWDLQFFSECEDSPSTPKHSINIQEIDHWLVALQKAKEYYISEGLL